MRSRAETSRLVAEPESEAAILEGCRAGDPRAAEAFVALHEKPLLRIVVHLVGRWSVAEEIVQDCFQKAFERMHEIDPSKGAQPWLYRVAINGARNYLRHSGRREVSAAVLDESTPPLFSAPVPDVAETSAAVERRRVVERALAALSPKLREVVVLHYIEGLPFTDIARILRRPVTGVRMRALRARAQLRALLREVAP